MAAAVTGGAMRDPGDQFMAFRLIAAGLLFLLLIWTLLSPPARGNPIPAAELMLRADTPALRFRWSLPPEATLDPRLFRALRADAEAELQAARAEAEALARAAARDGLPFRGNEWVQRWKLEAEAPAFLALSATTYQFTGGAHGLLSYAGALFDRTLGERIGFADLFRDSPSHRSALEALTPGWCATLDAERARRRGGERNAAFSDCPKLGEQLILPLGDAPIRAFRVFAAPYTAGPWSEGSYEIVIDAAPAVPHLAPRFAPAFARP